MDGEELMVPRVPPLPPEPSARQIAEHELTGHGVYRSWCHPLRSVERSSAAHASREEGELPDVGIDHGFFGCDREDVLSILIVKCRNGSTGCLAATVVEKARQTTFITSLGFKRILVKSNNEGSLLSLASPCLELLGWCSVGADDVSRWRSCSEWPRGGRC